MTERLKYSNYEIVFQEVPDEVSLAINITGCPYRCEGCHSSHLYSYYGENLTDNIRSLLEKYSGLITCVCFMGGDQNIEDLTTAVYIAKGLELKTCVYSGSEVMDKFLSLLPFLDYLKVGRYNNALGGLSSKTTNQRFYKVKNSALTDITSIFHTERIS